MKTQNHEKIGAPITTGPAWNLRQLKQTLSFLVGIASFKAVMSSGFARERRETPKRVEITQ